MESADDAHRIAETISESEERHASHSDRFRKYAAIFIGVLAMLLAITTLGGENATKEMLNANIHASDTFAFYQARNIRQTATQLALEELELRLATSADLTPPAREAIGRSIERYKQRVDRFESDPAGGEGKKELLARAQGYEAERDRARRQNPNFEYAQALFQIAIVLGSVAIVAASFPLIWLSAALAVLATLLSLNGFLLLVELPL